MADAMGWATVQCAWAEVSSSQGSEELPAQAQPLMLLAYHNHRSSSNRLARMAVARYVGLVLIAGDCQFERPRCHGHPQGMTGEW